MDDATQAFFQGVEAHFIQRRGQPLLLSPSDVGRVAEWHAAGIPLATVIAGIDIYFDRLTRRGRAPRRAATLMFVEDDVLDAWAGARNRRMGQPGAGAAAQAGSGAASAQALATRAEQARLLELLGESEKALADRGAAETHVATALRKAREKLATKTEFFEPERAGHDDQKAEDHLRRLERSVMTAAREALAESTTELASLEAAVDAELVGKRERMSETTLQRVMAQLLDKKLRQRFGIPRLSLFYA